MTDVVGVIWGRGEADYFCNRDWTGQIALKRLKKIAVTRIDYRKLVPVIWANAAMAARERFESS